MAKSIRDLQRKVERMGSRLEDNPPQAAQRGAATMATDMKADVVEEDAVASTELFRGITVTRAMSPSGHPRIRITSNAPHSGFVEFGTGAFHKPNKYTQRYNAPEFSGALVAALIEWATIKPSLQTDNPGAVGWAVARVISGEAEDTKRPPGTERSPFFFKNWKEHKHRIIGRVFGSAKMSARL